MGKKLTTEQFVARANKRFNNETIVNDNGVTEFKIRFDYTNTKYLGCGVKVEYRCEKHNMMCSQRANTHLRGNGGCVKCNIESRSKGYTLYTTTIFINKSKEIHGNDRFIYDNTTYINANTKITITCKKHGDFLTTLTHHIHHKTGCAKCVRKYWDIESFKKLGCKIHNNKYDYSKSIYVNSRTHLIIVCRRCNNSFKQLPNHHINDKNGCPKCSIKYWDIESFKKIGNKIHNNKYDYSRSIYIHSKIHLIIICRRCNNSFKQCPVYHISTKYGCPRCAKKYSKKQILWLNYVSNTNNVIIEHAENNKEHSIKNSKYHADGYCRETNTIYEFHGCFYHGCKKCTDENNINPITKKPYRDLYRKTIERENFIKSQGYNLITMWEHEWDLIYKYLKTLDDVNTHNDEKMLDWLREFMKNKDNTLDIHRDNEFPFRWYCSIGYIHMIKALWNIGLREDDYQINIRILDDITFKRACIHNNIAIAEWLCEKCDSYHVEINDNKIINWMIR